MAIRLGRDFIKMARCRLHGEMGDLLRTFAKPDFAAEGAVTG